MKYVTCFLLFFIATSCNYFDKRKVNADELLMEDLKTVNWNEVDEYPAFDACKTASTKQEQRACFETQLTSIISERLAKYDFIVTQEINDTIIIEFIVSEKGILEIKNINMSNEVREQIPTLSDIIHLSTDSLPKIQPANKRGQLVKTQFELPIILQAN